jgi:hypothetical protein
MKVAETEKHRWWLIFPTAITVMILNVGIHVLFMVVYSYVLNPGHTAEYYQSVAQATAPYSSIVAGLPLMFFAGRWIGKRFRHDRSVIAALFVWLTYCLIDLSIIVASSALAALLPIFIVSFSTKLLAAYLGGRAAKPALQNSSLKSLGVLLSAALWVTLFLL